MYYNCYRYHNRKKGTFIIIALGLIFLLLYDCPLNKLFVCCSDEFVGDEDDCECK
ncbi:MAG: hypothetical protein M0Q88_03960 [Bacilli bacterium]|nr:hypothetical protein [Bacilli bacterium]